MYIILFAYICTEFVGCGSLSDSAYISGNISESSIGATCSIERSCHHISGAECNLNTSKCECSASYPVNLQTKCIQGLRIGTACSYDEECSYVDSNSHCTVEKSGERRCRCRDGYSARQAAQPPSSSDLGVCLQNSGSIDHTDTVPAVAGLAIGLVILTFLLVFVAKLFSKARWHPSRGYGDANIPPTIVIDGKDISETTSRVYDAGDPLSSDELRKMSILSRITLPLNKDINVRSVSPSNSDEHHRLFGEGCAEHRDYKQHITIISSRPTYSRRQSLADYAFPELHSKSKKKKTGGNLLILTRTRTDTLGRRHSVAVPLLPPTEGYDLQADLLASNTPRTPVRRLSARRNSSQNSQLSNNSPDKLNLPRRPSRLSTRRSSRQDFLHFLDLAVAS